ncbi:hypothetical protein BS47DRAFT_1393260 [Hydnum rufescens UP504]|uniref:Protein transport protein SFT2 n=1 Tax=Hydnum rufescens UP504 TaxID=1448309 RepID=A0A9P6AX68_9AGAM|nr:hypothetical protein BS47DRAFT_1393260 [Hydnum rufescens UP504]
MSSEQNFRASLSQFRWAQSQSAPPTQNTPSEPNSLSRLYNSMSSYVPVRSDERTNEEQAYFALGRWERYPYSLNLISGGIKRSKHCRLLGFGACLVGSAVCFLVAFFTLPLLALRPGKFALAFSLGSLLVMFGSLRPINHLKHLASVERLPFSAAYLGSLGLTLYFSIGRKSYIGSLIFAIVQILALIAYVGAYFPGGWATMRFGGQMALRGAGSVLPF